uniref:Uncharacterized protein n=1 Tax=Panagrolaimus sp. ES5 TaxID=591445 RepID=A0AC34GBE6_9BILA
TQKQFKILKNTAKLRLPESKDIEFKIQTRKKKKEREMSFYPSPQEREGET